MARVGITGASGFIGGAIVPTLASRGFELTLIDNRSGPVWVEHREHPVRRADFSSDTALAALADCDAILHVGAVSGVMACARDPVGSARTNVEGTRSLVEVCVQRRIPIAFASSLAVVGAPEKLPVTEATPARPTHEYARQKAEGERIVATVATRGAAPVAVLRMSNVYGSYSVDGRGISKRNVLTEFVRQASEGRILVNAPGNQRRNFIHIEDVVSHWEAVIRWLRSASSSSSPPRSPVFTVFNVVSEETLGIGELADRVRSAYVRAHPHSSPPAVEVVKNPREGIELVDPRFEVSRALTERMLSVTCRHSVDRTLASALTPSDVG